MLLSIAGDVAVVAEPELRFNDSGVAWLKVRVVAKDRFFDPDAKEWKDRGDPCYLDLLVQGKAAENLYESVEKGTQLVVSGRLQMREWTTSEGDKRTSYQIRADNTGVSITFGALTKKDTVNREAAAQDRAAESSQDPNSPW